MPMNSNEFELVCDLVLRRSGIVLEAGKEYLVDARLSALARRLGLGSISAVVDKLKLRNADVERAVVDSMTTNETTFFRDIHPFEAFKKTVIPSILERHAGDRKLSIWCAASSTGQEPYTLAMLLRETIPQVANWKITFLATDLSRDVLERAKAGKYSQLEVNRGLPAQYLLKYFKKQGLEWEISQDVRSMVDFREVNLLETWPAMSGLDVVFIRNVLIYFNNETKKKILSRIRGLMRPDAYLFLGAAETTMNLDDNFVRTSFDKSGCYQLRTQAAKAAA